MCTGAAVCVVVWGTSFMCVGGGAFGGVAWVGRWDNEGFGGAVRVRRVVAECAVCINLCYCVGDCHFERVG